MLATQWNDEKEDLLWGGSGNCWSLCICLLLNFLPSSLKLKLWASRSSRGNSEEGCALLFLGWLCSLLEQLTLPKGTSSIF